ncbi:hypothetical protein [Thermopirellula anaerolimosa]
MMEILVGWVTLLYALALALELARPNLRFQARGFAVGMVLAGFLVHSAFLGYRAVVIWNQLQSAGAFLAVKQDWYFGLAWGLTAVCLAWMAFRPGFPFAALFLPLVLILLGVGFFLADPVPFERGAASKVWGFVHGLSLMGATLCILVAIVAGSVYLWQVRRVKKGIVGFARIRPPSLEWLQKANAHAVLAAIACLTLGIFSGIVLNAVAGESGEAALPWNDPVVVSTCAMFAWLAGTVLLGAVYRPLREGRKVAYFTFLSFVFLVLALALMLSGWTQHGKERPASRSAPTRSSRLVPRDGTLDAAWMRGLEQQPRVEVATGGGHGGMAFRGFRERPAAIFLWHKAATAGASPIHRSA